MERNQHGPPSVYPFLITKNNVIRYSAFEGNSLGAQSIGTSFTADQEVTGSYTIPLWSGWNISNLQVAVVIWSSTNADGISNSIIVDVN